MKKTILIVDDDMDTRTALGDILKEKGYGVSEATTAKEAIDKVRAVRPDIVLLDTKLPADGEGYEVCKKIKETEGDRVKVVIYTGCVDTVDALAAREAGADDYVVKTEGFPFLKETIEKLI